MIKKINLINFIKEVNQELNEKTNEIDHYEENEVSELHIHKILFILYGAFHKEFNKELFNPNFQAWKYGPVEIDFRKYFTNRKLNNINQNDEDLYNKFNYVLNNNQEKNFLKKVTTNLLKFSPWSLVEYTHSLDAWINNYCENTSKPNAIKKQDIFKSFQDIDF